MDYVFIEDLRIDTVIGIYDWERRTRQTIALDIEMSFDNTRSAASDAIGDTLDYKAVSKRLIAFVEDFEFPSLSKRWPNAAPLISRRIRRAVAAAQAVQAGRRCAASKRSASSLSAATKR